MQESKYLIDNNILLCIDPVNQNACFDELIKKFCGIVCFDFKSFLDLNKSNYSSLIYFCGNIESVNQVTEMKDFELIIIKDFSNNYDKYLNDSDGMLISYENVPINVNNVGVYFRNFFRSDLNYFDIIKKSHEFQTLTDSNKPSNAFRKGIYLSNVEVKSQINTNNTNNTENSDEYYFNLLRCSSNFEGPTDCFSEIDQQIITGVNIISKYFFSNPANLNHVLAQIYTNVQTDTITQTNKNSVKEKKAKIKEHSDKTKDMHKNGLMAFCSFYDFNNISKIVKTQGSASSDFFDVVYNNQSVLTQMKFKLKNPSSHPDLTPHFNITLYPNSVFIMSLEANRLYTHEIIPSILPIDKLPTRMGYVIRSSKTNAVHKNGQTYILDDNSLIPLRNPTEEEIIELKKLYYEENTTENFIDYNGLKLDFSLNNGDYQQPINKHSTNKLKNNQEIGKNLTQINLN